MSAAALLKWSQWHALMLSSITLSVALSLSLIFPDTRPVTNDLSSAERQPETSPLSDRPELDAPEGSIGKFTNTVRLMWSNPIILLLLSVFYMAVFGSQVTHLVLQYTTKRYQWDYSTVSLRLVYRGMTFFPSSGEGKHHTKLLISLKYI